MVIEKCVRGDDEDLLAGRIRVSHQPYGKADSVTTLTGGSRLASMTVQRVTYDSWKDSANNEAAKSVADTTEDPKYLSGYYGERLKVARERGL